jgi:dephospho-CoA kinase
MNVKIIGLTGMSGAGKSTASKTLAERGFHVIDCDTRAREAITSSPCIDEVALHFPETFTEEGFCRKRAAKFLFSNPHKLAHYQKIVFPYVVYKIIKEIEKSTKTVVLDAATLYQSKADDFCDEIIAITASKASCVERIIKRDSITEDDALMRLNNQPSADFFHENADYIIENNGNLNDFKKAIENVK